MAYYHTYTKRYFGEFDSIPRNGGSSDYYYFYISRKGIDLDIIDPLILAASPVVHTWLDDSPKPYIKGSELQITLINKDNLLPLDTFYSESDDEWKIEYFVRIDDGTTIEDKLLFTGYLVQEDCSEEVSDIAHEINLVFTDNLGLLKDISIQDAMKAVPKIGASVYSSRTFVSTQLDANNVKYIRFNSIIGNYIPQVNESVILESLPIGNGVYTITKVVTNGNVRNVYVNEELPDITSNQADYRIFSTYQTTDYVKLLDIYWLIIYSCGLPLEFVFANMIHEFSETPPVDQTRILEYIYLQINTFIETNNSDKLDTVIEKLNYRFSSSLFQSDGKWCLIRWNELRNTASYTFPADPLNYLKGDYYSTSFSWVKRDFITNSRSIGNGEDIEYGLLNSIERPLKKIINTFNYKLPDELLYNKDFSEVGDLISTTIVSGNTYKRYVAKGWTGNLPPTPDRGNPDRFIEVVYDSYDRETDRYLLITNGNLTYDQRYVYLQNFVSNSIAIPINKGDVIKLSYECKADQNYAGIISSKVFFGITTDPNDANDFYMLSNAGTWFLSPLVNITLDYNSNFDQWQTKSIESKPAPIDGVAYLSFTPFGYDINGTLYRNVSFEIETIEANRSVIGHEHTTYIPPTIKNIEDEEIFVDDSPRNNISGTLFLGTSIGVIRNKTTLWRDGILNAGNFRLGEVINRQEHLWRNKRRLKLEGNLFSIVKGNTTPSWHIMSMLNVLNYLINSGTYMIFGKLEIDYKENDADFTAYEMWRTGEEWFIDNNGFFIDKGILRDPNMVYNFKFLNK